MDNVSLLLGLLEACYNYSKWLNYWFLSGWNTIIVFFDVGTKQRVCTCRETLYMCVINLNFKAKIGNVYLLCWSPDHFTIHNNDRIRPSPLFFIILVLNALSWNNLSCFQEYEFQVRWPTVKLLTILLTNKRYI